MVPDPNAPLHWDLFCRVIDNHGDLGVCWRLARALARRGHVVRLWVDDANALAWMAPESEPGVVVKAWTDDAPDAVGDVVVEAFGCDPPAAMVATMARRQPAPVWINLEYLSAERWVERSHGLPSPTRWGLTKWFFFPGFTAATGGLLRDGDTQRPPEGPDGRQWLACQGWSAREDERVVSLFCYPNPRLQAWLQALAVQPTLLLATPGPAQDGLRALRAPPAVRVLELPWLPQPVYDTLLRSCDLNLVRGEDSFAQALWADAPLLWHIYPQHDGVHAGKLHAFLDLYLASLQPGPAAAVRQAFLHWNGLADNLALPDLASWARAHQAFSRGLLAQDDLATQLTRFVTAKRGAVQPAC
ncbi:MAG: hypothetical protein RJA10_3228 [Pseudomonadota bacterium]|jgi:uncharacterized repeat protein (TIGR03837 family)